MPEIRFSHHALQRARERKLWKYVSKEKFWYDAEYIDDGKVKINDCVYAFMHKNEVIIIKTMYRLAL